AVIDFNNVLRDYPDTKYAEEMEYLTIKAQYEYAKHSSDFKKEERFTQALTFEQQFAEKYPTSKYLAEAVSLKKDSEQGIVRAKRVLADYANTEKYLRRFEKKDTITSLSPAGKK
ncbi:MAG: outer membrane protein assembly factor BamD, partial [Mucilaginibacter sp.]